MILTAIYERSCVPFLGAGVNAGDGKDYKGLPGGRDVALRLIEGLTGVEVKDLDDLAKVIDIRKDIIDAGLAEDLARLNFQNLPRVALHIEVQSGGSGKRGYLLDRIREIIRDKSCKPSKPLELLARMPFDLVVTTNFDRLFERALDHAILQSLPIGVEDLKAPVELTCQFRDAKDPVSQYLKGQFSESTQQLLDNYDGEASPSAELLTSLAEALNQQLTNEYLYEETRFAGVILKGEVRDLITGNASGEQQKRLNRLLLEAAYPGLAKSRAAYEVVVQTGNDAEGKSDQYLSLLPEGTTIVYKIHGSFPKDEATAADPERTMKTKTGGASSLIITEEDYIQFMTIIGKSEGGIPNKISKSMVKGTMLFLGYGLEDWDFRTIYKGLIESQKNDDGRTAFAIQWQPSPFWEDYWKQKGVFIYHYDIHHFAEELKEKYVKRFGSLSAFKPLS